ncbi:flagellar biosynthesis protein FlhF [Clostridiaceae bacterium 14S0207]|nr:flagellar biosynthesis protein FlhF [Clostridiaceae bacterium 14S0207]
MLVKKYLVRNMSEGMARIKSEIGQDAIIISQKKVRQKGLKGFFSPKLIEITVSSEGAKKINSRTNNPVSNSIANKNINRSISKGTSFNNNENLKEEVTDMKKLLYAMYSNMNTEDMKKGEVLKNYKEFLLSKDVSSEFTAKIIEDLKPKGANEEKLEKELIKKSIINMMSWEFCNNEAKQGIFAFVGPTGVGKTTTIAKLAGKYTLLYKKKVGLITVDTYRIGAVEQLKTYAEIMNIPFSVVFNIKEMEDAIKKMQDCDVILVDTTGRSSKNLMQLQELRAFVNKTNADRTYLVLSSTTKLSDISSIIEGYKILNYNNLILTKLDETTTYGSILNVINQSGVPLSYLTTGQSVPEDIKNLNKEQLLDLILGEENLC